MIISASRRTDIPAFYSEWFMQRIREGYCLTANPFNRRQISHISLNPETVKLIVFWTKNARPLLVHLRELEARGYRYFFHYTINAYPQILEPRVPPWAETLSTVSTLAEHIGPERLIWRYDPILFSCHTDVNYHLQHFRELAQALAGKTRRVVVSLVDMYRKTISNSKALLGTGYAISEPTSPELAQLAHSLAEIASDYGLEIFTCAEENDWTEWGIPPGACIDPAYLKRTFALDVDSGRDRNQRTKCNCLPSKDIGAYETCRHGCVYCYAGTLTEIKGTPAWHDIDSPSLVAIIEE